MHAAGELRSAEKNIAGLLVFVKLQKAAEFMVWTGWALWIACPNQETFF